MATERIVKTARMLDRYHVEIRHPGREDWNHIYSPGRERTTLLALARQNAAQVAADEPEAEVRIMRTMYSRITTVATGKSRAVQVGSEVVDR